MGPTKALDSLVRPLDTRSMYRRRAMLTSILVVLAASLLAPSANAASISVTTTADEFGSGAKCSLREAIHAANQDSAFGGCPGGSGNDAIALKVGTYQLTRQGSDDTNNNGDLDVMSSIKVTGAQRDATVIHVSGAEPPGDRAFHVADGSSLDLRNLTVVGGRASTPTNGGGVLGGTGVTLKLTDVTIAANWAASDGGGIYVQDGDVTLRRALIDGNDADGNGGGINQEHGDLTIVDSTVSNNATPGNNGGGIDAETDVVAEIKRSRITGNYADSNGGGIYASSDSSLLLTDSTVADNRAGNVGGGIRSVDAVELLRTTLSNNHAGSDGGGMIAYSIALIQNSTISNNMSDTDGGGLYLTPQIGTGASIYNSTIARNMADADDDGSGDGGGVFSDEPTLPVKLANTLVAGNVDPGDEAPDCAGPHLSEGHNLIGLNTTCGTFDGTDLVGTGPAIAPRLGPLSMNGGRTATHALLADSPAIGAGDPNAPGTNHPACIRADQRGVPRKSCDIGAYERVTCFGRLVNVVGTEQKDKLKGTTAAEVFLTLGGNDVVDGSGGIDALCGGGGNDKLKGGGAADKLSGGNGVDGLNGGPGNDLCVGGTGKDTASACETQQSI